MQCNIQWRYAIKQFQYIYSVQILTCSVQISFSQFHTFKRSK
ncbi:hypothetical protein F383_12915 [Gossypium arboreum]|uniref:Uncharacterized protein n=1 Tax=Gossypium arboreum TaxID=29729 RepID=A0A0B0N7J5_GOSAR|nr:hypothetical protein F383_12915 [Gossypium arboreum]